jgi:hypothetical protein
MILQPEGMELHKNFEEEFAGDTWNNLTEKVALDTSLSVVSLASFHGNCAVTIRSLLSFFYFSTLVAIIIFVSTLIAIIIFASTLIAIIIFVGETRFFACTGVLIGRHKSITRILTSASLVRIANKNEVDVNLKVCTANHSISACLFYIPANHGHNILYVNSHRHSLQIRVLLPNNKHATGKLQHYNLHYNIAVVSIRGFHCRRIAKLYIEEPVDVPLNDEVVAIGRTFETGKLMATSGVLTDNSSNFICEEHGISTCKITKVHRIGFTCSGIISH